MSIYVGAKEIQDLKICSTDVQEVYVGSQQVWTRGDGTVDTGWTGDFLSSDSQLGKTEWATPEALWNKSGTQYCYFDADQLGEIGYNYGVIPALPANVSNILEFGIWFKLAEIGSAEWAYIEVLNAQDGSPPPGGEANLMRVPGGTANYELKDTNILSTPANHGGFFYYGDWSVFRGNDPVLLAWLRGGATLGLYSEQKADLDTLSRFYTYAWRCLYETS
jgi:hypothetical protein